MQLDTALWRRDIAALLNPGDVAAEVLNLLGTATREIDGNNRAAKASIDRASELLRLGIRRKSSADSQPGGLLAWQVRKLNVYIDANLSKSLSVDELARLVRLRVSHFSRAFKCSFGVPPHSYLTRRRVERARQLMLTTDISLAQISQQCGFSDQSHLSRSFHRLAGISPNAWRQEYGQTQKMREAS